jgi:hypothetical protein
MQELLGFYKGSFCSGEVESKKTIKAKDMKATIKKISCRDLSFKYVPIH